MLTRCVRAVRGVRPDGIAAHAAPRALAPPRWRPGLRAPLRASLASRKRRAPAAFLPKPRSYKFKAPVRLLALPHPHALARSQVQWADAARPVLRLEVTSGAQAGSVYSVPPHLKEVRCGLPTRPCHPRGVETRSCAGSTLRDGRAAVSVGFPQSHTHSRSAPLALPQLNVGRVAANDFVINDTEVSSQHARIGWDPDRQRWQLVRGVVVLSVNSVGTLSHSLPLARRWTLVR